MYIQRNGKIFLIQVFPNPKINTFSIFPNHPTKKHHWSFCERIFIKSGKGVGRDLILRMQYFPQMKLFSCCNFSEDLTIFIPFLLANSWTCGGGGFANESKYSKEESFKWLKCIQWIFLILIKSIIFIRIRSLKQNSEVNKKEKHIFGSIVEISNKKKYFFFYF